MFMTGCTETELGGEYDGIIDAAAILLIKSYGDTTCLKALGDMIFRRHRRGLYTYDAEWAFFESGDPDCLAMAAGRLLSPDKSDNLLARRLLKFLPCCGADTKEPGRQYERIMNWLSQNKPFMYYTGESNQMCGSPCRYRVSDELKYLQMQAADYGGPPSRRVQMSAPDISVLDTDTKRLLGECSHILRKSGRQRWMRWMQSPLPVQIEAAKRIAGKRAQNGNG
jgi:hypothetical protein